MKIQIDSPLRDGASAVLRVVSSALGLLSSVFRRFRCALCPPRLATGPPPPPEQLTLDLDQSTAAGLPLREALPVRSAEYWLQLGQPDQALKELESLPETVRRHPWPLRVHLAALHATNAV